MTENDVRARAFAMPLTSPAFPPGPYQFVNREFFIITYRTDPDALKAVIPAPLEFTEPLVKYEFIRMPDSTGFGDYTETGQVIPVRFQRATGGYVHAMFLDDEAPIAGGRELWGFPKNLRRPSCRWKRTRCWASSSMDRSQSRSPRWDTNIARSTSHRSSRRSPPRVFC